MLRPRLYNKFSNTLCRIQWGRYIIIPGIPMAVLAIMCFLALFAPFIAPFNPNQGNLYDQFIPPSWMEGGTSEHFLGTDYFGRDILSRLIFGARVSISVALIAISFSAIIGTVIGLISGYYGGKVDTILMRLVDAWLSFPVILIAILLAVVLGPSYLNLILILTLLMCPRFARLIRGETLVVKEQDYVAMGKVTGSRPLQIMMKHIFPNIVPTLLVLATFEIGGVIMAEAALSFLGVGIPSPTASWGSMTAAGRDYIATMWWLSVFPGFAILLTVLAVNLVGDWLRDHLDPKLRQV